MNFEQRRQSVLQNYHSLIGRANQPVLPGNGIFNRYINPVLTAEHIPPTWLYDFDRRSNPYFMTRLGVNAVFNAGAIKWGDQYVLMCRVEGWDRKSFFAIARSRQPDSGFVFDAEPIQLPQTQNPDVNVYDMRLTAHQDGYMYGLFCSERKDLSAGASDTSAALATAGIVRSKDLVAWERLPDLVTNSPQQRNVVLHPEFYEGSYLFFTRPQDGFVETGSGGGICWGLSKTMQDPRIDREELVDPRLYHTIKELKNGAGAVPIKTSAGWLHIAHGVRGTAAGLRYVVYAFMTEIDRPYQVCHAPGGYLIAPEQDERIGDVSNVCFVNGAIADDDGRLYIYYASSDTRLHVASTTIDQMVDYCLHTAPDRLFSHLVVEDRIAMIRKNAALGDSSGS